MIAFRKAAIDEGVVPGHFEPMGSGERRHVGPGIVAPLVAWPGERRLQESFIPDPGATAVLRDLVRVKDLDHDPSQP